MNEAIMKKSFCPYCGTKYDEGAAFCHHCGVAVEVSDSSTTSPTSPRRIIYDGQIYKCPNCGDIIDSFESYCHMCGYELRDTKPSSIVNELTSRLEMIDDDTEKNKPKGFLAMLNHELFDLSDNERKVNLIKNYPIPNTKEDMLELMIYATSHIDLDAFDGMKVTSCKNPKESHAWHSMVKRIYDKARVSDFRDGTFFDIKQLYDECEKKVRKAKLGPWKYLGVCIGLFFLAILVWAVPQAFSKPDTSEYIVTEEARLDGIVSDVEEALSIDEYQYALDLADLLYYQGSDSNLKKRWNVEREYWEAKIRRKASENGVLLEDWKIQKNGG